MGTTSGLFERGDPIFERAMTKETIMMIRYEDEEV